ncbi:thiol S-methyltransferase TMT1B-like [Haemaphysalis longicornis]
MAKAPLYRVLDYVFLTIVFILAAVFAVPLRLSPRLHQWFFVRVFAVIKMLWHEAFEGVRRETLAAVDAVESHDLELRADGAVRLLEVGAGFGANFEHMRRRVKYWNVDPNTEFQSAFLETLKKFPKVEMERWVPCYAENMKQVPDNHFDVVLITHVLCSVHNAEMVLQECKRVLVKGGRLVFMEHVAFPEGTLGRLQQKVASPLWWLVCCGCHLNRRGDELIRRAGFAKVRLQEKRLDVPLIVARHVYGYAVA